MSSSPQLLPCRSVDCYIKLNRIEEGTYGVVYRGQDKATGEIVALKKLKLEKEKEGFPVTSLREINALMHAAPGHPHIVGLRELVVGKELASVFIVMDFIEHDLRSLMDEMTSPFSASEVKTLLKQLLSAVSAMHHRHMVHRDLKTANLLLSNRGEIKVADFGLARKLPPYEGESLHRWSSRGGTGHRNCCLAPEHMNGMWTCGPLGAYLGSWWRGGRYSRGKAKSNKSA